MFLRSLALPSLLGLAGLSSRATAQQPRLAFLTALDVANAAARPVWNAASRQRLVTQGQ